jgi:ABC-type Mn2+/Zn2+ transport system ATPase subunit
MPENNNQYLQPLPADTTLCVYSGAQLIFANSGKWLMPLFDLEKFFASYTGQRTDLSAHDTAVGKAAIVLMVRLGITRIHANIASSLAFAYVDTLNETRPDKNKILLSCSNRVPQLLCATESLLSGMTDSDTMYSLLRRRAKKTAGVSVEINNLSFQYGAIHNLSLSIPAGDRIMILGENGAGKTTLLRLIAGIYIPQSGTIVIDGKKPHTLPSRTIGYIPQQADNALFSLSVEEVVSIGLEFNAQNKKQRIHTALVRTAAEHLAGRNYTSLSGGEKQKVSLARCLAQNAKLLLLDEPTTALDTESRAMVTNILRSLSVSEIPTIIVVTHDNELVRTLGWNTFQLQCNGGIPHE